jgi:hypothetical protein
MGRRRLDPVANWWSKVVIGPGCWTWRAGRDKDGYGKLAIGAGGSAQVHTRAHRFAYETFIGPIPEGMVVCHRCDNPPCARPSHLFVGTPRDNNDDKIAKGREARPWGTPLTNSRKTHCKRGHPLEGANLYIYNGMRNCKACRRASVRASYYRKRAAA